MYILLMIVFSQPYGVEYIHNIGEYSVKQTCIEERNRAIKLLNESGASYTAFGCVPVSDLLKNKPTYS
tara:strand:+ start:1149 stop:1352 length:204 start_codon:yes stop_codon:yes gene_type:complete